MLKKKDNSGLVLFHGKPGTDHKNIDEALMRKGRLIASYKFDDLSNVKLEKLKSALDLRDFEIKEGMSLADLYHSKENQFGNTDARKVIWFA